ncbi:MAG TPA: hypothetical protein VJC07_05370, partial [Candidatus Nanoarchaeia archaeon]|nr:hypothetical protein [Candidatus Nanoarchaeia archaeon]
MDNKFLIVPLAFLAVFLSSGIVSADLLGWITDRRLTFDPAESFDPSSSTDPNGNVHVAWSDYRNGN